MNLNLAHLHILYLFTDNLILMVVDILYRHVHCVGVNSVTTKVGI